MNLLHVFVGHEVRDPPHLRCIVNWVFCICIAGMVLLCWSVLSNPGHPTAFYFVELWQQYQLLFGTSIVLLLIAMIDFVRISNRFCGPVVRLKNELKRVAEGETVQPIVFREDDYWKEIAESFNAVIKKIPASEETAASENSVKA